ncbi:FAD-binding protein [Nakamurella silvestris]|nr:FAD-binding protein [Nakamurella silvestris]
MTWANWTGDERCDPSVILRPTSVEEVAALVRSAADTGTPVRVVGSGHSFSDLVLTDGIMVDLSGLTGLLRVEAGTGLVRVAAGTTLAELNVLLDRHGLAMPNLGDIDHQTLAGAISTGTHGTGARLGNLATQVTAIQLVAADGTIHELTGQDDALTAARIGLGSLGIITAYTLKVVPAFHLRAQSGPMAVSELLGRLTEFVDGNDHFEFYYFPHAPTALAKLNNRSQEPLRRPTKVRQFVEVDLLENQALDLVCRVGRRLPAQIPRFNRMVTGFLTPASRVEVSHRAFVSHRSIRFTETEWSIPREACADMLRDIQHVIERQGLAVNFPLEVRFVAGDQASDLSPVYGRDSAYIAAHMYRNMNWRPYFAAVQEIALGYGGRPHWGKRHQLDAARLADLYPAWEQFQQARRKFDPTGLFANNHIRRVLGP